MEKRNRSLIDAHPNLQDKESLRISATTILRKRAPTNMNTASKVPNMVFDHSNQMRIWPDKRPKALIETTQKTNEHDYRTVNRSGHPFALGVNVGGSPDDPGHPFLKLEKTRILK